MTRRFEFFDPKQEYTVTYGDLPHWEQPGVTYFITFRTHDSLPKSVVSNWRRERDEWLTRKTGVSHRVPWPDKARLLSDEDYRQFHRVFRHKLELELDKSHGNCPLVDSDLSSIVSDSLRYFDGQRYHLGDFVVMPNHVHLLVCMFASVSMRKQCYSWKHYTAKKINKAIQSSGTVWQAESFDHLVRDADHFERFQKYIQENPARIGV